MVKKEPWRGRKKERKEKKREKREKTRQGGERKRKKKEESLRGSYHEHLKSSGRFTSARLRLSIPDARVRVSLLVE